MIDFAQRLDTTILRFDLLTHPFYQAWIAGELTRDDLREYAIDYYHHVAAFPIYLRHFCNRLCAGELKQRVFENLCEELGMRKPDDRPHSEMWIAFAKCIGADSVLMLSVLLRGVVQLSCRLSQFLSEGSSHFSTNTTQHNGDPLF